MKSARAPEIRLGEDYGAYGADYRFLPVEETADANLRRMYARWKDISGERAMPRRANLNPLSLRDGLRNSLFFDVIDGGRDFCCRVMGSNVVEQTRLDLTGKTLLGVEDERVRARVLAALCRVMETGAAVRMVAAQCTVPHLSHKQSETLCLPLGDDAHITHILVGVTFSNRAAA